MFCKGESDKRITYNHPLNTSEYIRRIPSKPMKTMEQIIKKKCLPDPIVHKEIITKNDDDKEFTLVIKAYKSKHRTNYEYIYFFISCDLRYNDDLFDDHPFRLISQDCGVVNSKDVHQIVVDNELTRLILKMLCMSDEDLSQMSGSRSIVGYRSTLIKLLIDLWD